jgi:hypothetical protein
VAPCVSVAIVTLMVLPAGVLPLGGVSVGVLHTHCVGPAVCAHACRIVTAMIAASTSNERATFFITPPSVVPQGFFVKHAVSPDYYFAAPDASFWKRGSFRNGSNIGSSRSSAGVSGTF